MDTYAAAEAAASFSAASSLDLGGGGSDVGVEGKRTKAHQITPMRCGSHAGTRLVMPRTFRQTQEVYNSRLGSCLESLVLYGSSGVC